MKEKKSTLADMAKITGLSIATISRAINENGYVSQQNIELIKSAQEQLDYYPSKKHKTSKKGANPKVILICLPDNKSVFWLDYLSAIQEICSKRKFYPLLVYTKPTEAEEVNIIKATERMKVSGVLVVTLSASNTLCSVLNQITLPKVLCAVHAIDDTNFQYNFDRVSVDSKRGIFGATNHLIEQGCKTLAYIGIKTHLVNGKARLDGFLDALQYHNMEPDESCIKLEEDWECEENGYASMYAFHRLGRIPDGVVCINDRAALGVLSACRELGISVPETVKVIGMDNTDITKYVTPTLSSVDIAPYELAKLSIKLLFSRIDDSSALYQNNILMPNVIVRESSVQPPASRQK